jgi:prepilin-type processing-associated H-X9-DG protein
VIYVWYGANGTSSSTSYIPMQRCPSDDNKIRVPRKITAIRNSSQIALLFDGIGSVNIQQQNANRINARHGTSARNKQTNIVFADSHVETMFTKDLPGGVDNANQPDAKTTFSLPSLANYPYPKWRLDQP